jgi:hypothetical protein
MYLLDACVFISLGDFLGVAAKNIEERFKGF